MEPLWKVKGLEKQTSWKVMRFSRENEQKKKVTPTCTLTTWSFQRAAPHTPHSNTTQQHSTAHPFTRACLQFLTTLTCRALYGKCIAMDSPAVYPRLFSTTLTFRTPQENHIVSVPFDTIEKNKNVFSIFLVSPGHLGTIQNLIPGCMTIVKLIKRVKNWQSPSLDPWSNCLINSRETTKGQINYYSGRQKDISKTICRRAG